MKMKNNKSFWGLVCATVLFLVLAYGFVPQVLGGKIVNQGDITGYLGMSHEATTWNHNHPSDHTAWTNSMFGGMPTTMLTGNPQGDWTQKIYNLFLVGKRPASYLFISLLGAFLLMLSLGIGPLVAAGGAIAVTFCSYNLQIIQVGHNSKMLALAFLPWVLASVVFTYRSASKEKRWLPLTILGASLFAMALNFQLKANHIQISYYLAIIIFCYAIVSLVWILARRKELLGRFFAASGLLLVLGCMGIATNANKLIPEYLYSQETMRGGSELTSSDGTSGTKGLDLDYATSWSYGWEELPNTMIANFNGGSSDGEVNPDKSETIALLRQAGQGNLGQVARHLPLYWGPQPFTAGPMYMGAISIFLFIMGLLLCEGKERWWILIPTVIAVLLAVGNNFLPFTKFWYYHMPFYSKFRTVSMALVILQFTLPMLGFLALDKLVRGTVEMERFKRASLIALALTGGFCLLCVLFPGIAGSFTSPSDSQMGPQLSAALASDRRHLLVNDALTSGIFIGLTYLLLLWGYTGGEKASASPSRRLQAAAAICVLVLVNLWSTGKRYLNSEDFVTPRQFNSTFTETAADKAILQDSTLGYRTLDLTASPFNDSRTSYFHRSIGGYSPVKLQRYQDLIDRYLISEITDMQSSLSKVSTYAEASEVIDAPLLSMLNDKYVIISQDAAPIVNTKAQGPVWFVNSVVMAANPDEEIALLGKVDLKNTAVVGADFKEGYDKAVSTLSAASDKASAAVPADSASAASTDKIEMTAYAPNKLTYSYSAGSGKVAVFSEIWYPRGWKAQLEDGTEIPLYRANWTLRAANLPAGNHTLTMSFAPKSYAQSSGISRTFSIALILITLLSAAWIFVQRKEDRKAA